MMSEYLDTIFSPSLYLDRDKAAIAYIEDRLLHQEACASVCMYGNGKDYLFVNVVKRFEARAQTYQLKVLNTISEDELRDFADDLKRTQGPVLCLVNLRVRKDVSWFVQVIDELRVKRGHAFVSYINSYAGDVYEALLSTKQPITHSLMILKRVPFADAAHVIQELAERFVFYPTDDQQRDIYTWSYGHVGMVRTLFLLKRQSPDHSFTRARLLREPTVLERLSNILHDIPQATLQRLRNGTLSFVERTLLEEFGYIDTAGVLFHPLLVPLLPAAFGRQRAVMSATEIKVLEYLRAHQKEIVPREAIGRLVWGEEEWEDKYSDWAISQLMYRLRKKIDPMQGGGTIETRKGQGFVYAQLAA